MENNKREGGMKGTPILDNMSWSGKRKYKQGVSWFIWLRARGKKKKGCSLKEQLQYKGTGTVTQTKGRQAPYVGQYGWEQGPCGLASLTPQWPPGPCFQHLLPLQPLHEGDTGTKNLKHSRLLPRQLQIGYPQDRGLCSSSPLPQLLPHCQSSPGPPGLHPFHLQPFSQGSPISDPGNPAHISHISSPPKFPGTHSLHRGWLYSRPFLGV